MMHLRRTRQTVRYRATIPPPFANKAIHLLKGVLQNQRGHHRILTSNEALHFKALSEDCYSSGMINNFD